MLSSRFKVDNKLLIAYFEPSTQHLDKKPSEKLLFKRVLWAFLYPSSSFSLA
jgi:hypothetical protein